MHDGISQSSAKSGASAPIIPARTAIKLWLGENTDHAIFNCPPGYCNTIQAFDRIGKQFFVNEWMGKHVTLLNYTLSLPPSREKLYMDDRFCLELAKKQKPYFDNFKKVAGLCGLRTDPYDDYNNKGAWDAIESDRDKIYDLLSEMQRKATDVADALSKWLKIGDVETCYRIANTSQIEMISKERWNIDKPINTFKALSIDSRYGPESFEMADSYLFFNEQGIQSCLSHFTTSIPISGFNSVYRSEFMEAMDYIIQKAGITDTHQPTIKELKDTVEDAMTLFKLGTSANAAKFLTTFVKRDHKRKGGAPKKNN
ncbi:MAG: hypothetical protein ACI9KA_000232 [Parasphingorhabdus sp.]|jgi:hypothetical protein|uniref:hypothetical protein n=1 Tax=Parasphingorhabdus sp. TaxID=2709688 RepID=UPI0039E5BB38